MREARSSQNARGGRGYKDRLDYRNRWLDLQFGMTMVIITNTWQMDFECDGSYSRRVERRGTPGNRSSWLRAPLGVSGKVGRRSQSRRGICLGYWPLAGGRWSGASWWWGGRRLIARLEAAGIFQGMPLPHENHGSFPPMTVGCRSARRIGGGCSSFWDAQDQGSTRRFQCSSISN